MRLDPGPCAKGRWCLEHLAERPLTRFQIVSLAEKVWEKPSDARAIPCTMGALQEAKLVVYDRPSRHYWITGFGLETLARLQAGETVDIVIVGRPNVRIFVRGQAA